MEIDANERNKKLDQEKSIRDKQFELLKQQVELQFQLQMSMINMAIINQYNQYAMNQNNKDNKDNNPQQNNNGNQNIPFMFPIFGMPIMGMGMNSNNRQNNNGMPMMNNLFGFPMMNMDMMNQNKK